jgi:hypothetical protein
MCSGLRYVSQLAKQSCISASLPCVVLADRSSGRPLRHSTLSDRWVSLCYLTFPPVLFTGEANERTKVLSNSYSVYRSSGVSVNIIIATNVVTAFYAATFPSLVHDLPKLIESEQEVQAGTKSSVFLRPSA